MTESIDIKIVIDPSLVDYFQDEMARKHIEYSTTEELTRFLTTVLNDSLYPISSRKVGDCEIHLGYRAKSFADPIF